MKAYDYDFGIPRIVPEQRKALSDRWLLLLSGITIFFALWIAFTLAMVWPV